MSAVPPPTEPIQQNSSQIDVLRAKLADHAVYTSLKTIEDLRFFMERHVVCVWDFMSLLKSLQASLTCVSWPWTPPAHSDAARLVNEIVLGEESDEVAPGVHKSHFDWYLEAMEEVGADRRPMDRLIGALRSGTHWTTALEECGLPREAREFALTTLRLASGPVHVRASAFFHGREALIPVMFIELVRELKSDGHPCGTLNAYLDRHIEVDDGEHGPLAAQLLETVIGGDPTRAAEARESALMALRARFRLWTAIENGVNAPRPARARAQAVRRFFGQD